MAIKFISVKCPECGASLPIEEGRKQVFCSYCGTKVMVTNENEYIYRHIDEADVKKAETDRIIRMRQQELDAQLNAQNTGIRKILTTIWLILSLIILAICVVKIAFLDDFITGFLMLFYVGGPVIGGGGYLIFKLIPEKESDKALLNRGGIRFPKDIMPLSDKNYESVRSALEAAGFTNVKCVNMHDVTLGLLQKPGKVESISVNGTNITTGGRVYMPNTPIIITYHGK